MNINYHQLLNQIRNNNNAMNNQTVQNVFNCLDAKDHNSLQEEFLADWISLYGRQVIELLDDLLVKCSNQKYHIV